MSNLSAFDLPLEFRQIFFVVFRFHFDLLRRLTEQFQLKGFDSFDSEFGVRLEWLETGEGKMYKEHDTSIIAQLEAEYSLSPKSRELIENFLKLPPDVRNLVAEAAARATVLYPRKPYSQKSVDEMRKETNFELDDVEAARKRGTLTSLASTISSGSSKKSFKST